jgi:hypothetical protein
LGGGGGCGDIWGYIEEKVGIHICYVMYIKVGVIDISWFNELSFETGHYFLIVGMNVCQYSACHFYWHSCQ